MVVPAETISSPHNHNYYATFDHDEQDVLLHSDWGRPPLLESDECSEKMTPDSSFNGDTVAHR